MAKIILTVDLQNKNAIKGIKALETQIQGLSTSLSEVKVNKDLTAQINALSKYYKSLADAGERATKSLNATESSIYSTKKQAASLYTEIAKLNAKENGKYDSLAKDATRYLAKMQELASAYDKNGKLTETELKQLQSVRSEITKLSATVKSHTAVTTNYTNQEKKVAAQQTNTANSAQKLQEKFANLLNTLNSLEKNYKKGTFDGIKTETQQYLTEIKGLDEQLKNGEITQEQYDAKVQSATSALQGLTTQMATTRAESKTLHGSLQDIVSGFLKFQLSAMLVMKPLQMIRSAISSINETLVKTEDTIIAFQRVVGKNISGETISSELYGLAQQYGQTFDNVQSIALDFARTGLSWNDTIKATEAALLGLNTAELSADDAAQGLIAVLQQFGKEASELESVIDKLNITQDNAAVTTDKLLTALQRTGSSARNANLTLEETVALITALSSATGRSGENLGTALNSLIQYSSKSSALNVFAGLSDNSAQVVAKYKSGAATILDVWRQVSQEINNLSETQADYLDAYFNTEEGSALKDALDAELGDIYSDLDGVYTTANTFRKNYFIALLGNMDEVEKALGNMDDAVGYSQKQNEDYMESYTAKVNKLNASWQELANSAQGILWLKKFFVDLGTGVVELVKNTGGLRTTLLAISSIIPLLIGTKVVNGIKSIFTAITTGVSTLQATLGIIGLIATATSLIIGAIDAKRAADEEKALTGLQNASDGLTTLRDNLKETADAYDEYAEKVKNAREILSNSASTTGEISSAQNILLGIQNNLIQSNSAYADSLDLTNGKLSEQLGLIKQMGEEETRKQVAEYLDKNANAIYYAQEYLNGTSDYIQFGEYSSGWENTSSLILYSWLKKQGFNADDIGAYVDKTKGIGSQIGDAFTSLVGVKSLLTTLNTDGLTPDEQIAFLNELKERAVGDENESYIRALLQDAIDAIEESEKYINSNAILNGSDNTWGAPIEVLQEFVNSAAPDAYEQFLKKIGLLNDEISKEIAVQTNDISKLSDSYSNLISKLEELRDINKESYEWEEKKLAVLEAEKALEDARNQATVRRYNSATGQWEWQVDDKAIKEAESNLESAKQDLSDETFNRIIDLLENQTATNENIDEIAKDAGTVMGEEFVKTIRDFFLNETGVNIAEAPRTEIITTSGSYDSGGIANGLGYMAKATNQPETVNGPDLTAQILSPQSNREWETYARTMGIMFEQAHNFASRPIIERVGDNTDNSVNNSGQVIMNGVAIGSDKREDSINSVLRMVGIVNN